MRIARVLVCGGRNAILFDEETNEDLAYFTITGRCVWLEIKPRKKFVNLREAALWWCSQHDYSIVVSQLGVSDAHAAQQLFRRLGRQNKLLLARRDKVTMTLIDDWSADARALLLAMCDANK